MKSRTFEGATNWLSNPLKSKPMKQYRISFYKRRKDWLPVAVYYREFDSYTELEQWCKAIQTECSYHRYFNETVDMKTFLANTNL